MLYVLFPCGFTPLYCVIWPLSKDVLSRHHFLFIITKFYYYIRSNKKTIRKLNKEELIDESLTVNSVDEELANLTSRFDEFLEKYAQVESELEISKNWTKLLSKQIETLHRNTFGEK